MTRQPKAWARLLVGAAGLGLLASLLGGVVAWSLIGTMAGGVSQTLAASAESLNTLVLTIEAAETTVGETRQGLRTTADASAQIERALNDARPLLEGVAEISGGSLPDNLEALEATLPSLIRVGEGIDRVLAGLEGLGLAEPLDEGLGDGLRQIQQSLEGLPEQLRAQSTLLERMAEDVEIVSEEVAHIGDDLRSVESSLAVTEELLETQGQAAADAGGFLDELRADLQRQILAARILIVLLTASVALSQGVLMVIGVGLIRAAP